ncbi:MULTISPECIES: hypothetical protein [unclassified Agarivorans]|uniref:hypothetical protein n=1 Tax=unclassified Agarivorans TaxID=2636026 RepID=UPI0010EA4C0F|nr:MULTISPECIES: hypothetical protein [unclassified Agarivorans]MDO6764453.1 hypothetical protein [Agarivorans sp. 1_MG-2023]GDY28224.1 hypothetical protein AHAT_41140 [Agarivorans sp. Toyoura001]
MIRNTLIVLLLSLVGLSACVQMPTSTSTTIDNRPQLSFIAASEQINLSDYSVWVDGLESGLASDYQAEKAALRVLSGTHQIELKKAGEIIQKETIYLGDGVTKHMVVN